jgi:hypothetical protein
MNAVTLPPFGIFINIKQRRNLQLLRHELRHWAQYERMGLVRFCIGYMAANIKYGYDHNPFEIEARSNENHFARYNYTEAVRTGLARTVSNPNFRK